ncbi:MAG: rRNA cytosine-C5-methyltransferase [Bacteroidetes bacterium]|nr:rRNA cytosine-C5-methyltransferase [Bacteroidota bacterium]
MAKIDSFFPQPFALRMERSLNNDWPRFVDAHQQPTPTSIRINPEKNSGKNLEKVLWSEYGYYLNERPLFTFDPLFHAGTYYVQEASSMFLEHALKQSIDLTKPLRVLDLCAAPGGKSTHLLSLLNKESLLVCNETISARATILAENVCKWGNYNVVVTNNDPETFQKLEGFFDIILVDAPCSGEGLFRKDKSAMEEWSEQNVELCTLRQRRIVDQIWPALKQNGILIYCTCTYNEKENEENIKWLVDHKKAESIALNIKSDWGIEEIHNENSYGYRFYPHQIKGEGFFISVIQKKEEQHEITAHTKKIFDHPPKKIIERLTNWFANFDEIEFVLHNELMLALSKKYLFDITLLNKALRIIQKGTAVATAKHDKLVPEHAFALSHHINKENFKSIELNYEQAIAYLRKDALTIEGERGYALLNFENTPIGWANLLGNRANNLYPSNWRIRS